MKSSVEWKKSDFIKSAPLARQYWCRTKSRVVTRFPANVESKRWSKAKISVATTGTSAQVEKRMPRTTVSNSPTPLTGKVCKIEIGKCLLFATLLTSVCFRAILSDDASSTDPQHSAPTNEPGKFLFIFFGRIYRWI